MASDSLSDQMEAHARDMEDHKLIAAMEHARITADVMEGIGKPQMAKATREDGQIFRKELEHRNPAFKHWGKHNAELN